MQENCTQHNVSMYYNDNINFHYEVVEQTKIKAS